MEEMESDIEKWDDKVFQVTEVSRFYSRSYFCGWAAE